MYAYDNQINIKNSENFETYVRLNFGVPVISNGFLTKSSLEYINNVTKNVLT